MYKVLNIKCGPALHTRHEIGGKIFKNLCSFERMAIQYLGGPDSTEESYRRCYAVWASTF